ncbi:MAG: DoxX family protein [Alteromonadaceae bacterium]|nr:DoxX family protein [Alteromonadaceae bacterium]
MQQLTTVARFGLLIFFLVFAIPKFLSHELSVFIFTQLDVEPWGRYLTGLIEIIIAVLLLREATLLFGLLLGLITIVSALIVHFTVIGIVISNPANTINDEASTFISAVTIFVLLVLNLVLNRKGLQKQIEKWFVKA